MIKIEDLKPFEKMVVQAWLRRLNHYHEFGERDWDTGIYTPPVINREKHLGKAWKIYRRYHNIIDKVY